MKAIYYYLLIFLVVFLLLRFVGVAFSFLMIVSARFISFLFRFWYVSLPLLIWLFWELRRKREVKKFKKTTGLDPKDEIKLKQEPRIEDED